MEKFIQENIASFFDLLPHSLLECGEVYLVGGCVRDACLGVSNHDLDLVVIGDVSKAAKMTARHLNSGTCFKLDEERNGWRVIADIEDQQLMIDFASSRAANIYEDLQLRDFTINAIAVSLRNPAVLIDPTGGLLDLREKNVRGCAPATFQDDPVRTIRAVRFAADMQFRIEPQTIIWLKESVEALFRVSPERIRDEFFRVCTCRQPVRAIHALEATGILFQIFPVLKALKDLPQAHPDPLDVWQHTLGVVKGLQSLLAVLIGDYPSEGTGNLFLGSSVLALGRYRKDLEGIYKTCLVQNRTLQGLLYWSALLHDVGKAQVVQIDSTGSTRFPEHAQAGGQTAESIGAHLKLSRAEVQRISRAVCGHQILHHLAEGKADASRLGIYQLYRQYGEGILDICLLGLADTLGKYQQRPPEELWQKENQAARLLMEAWFEKRTELVDPPRLLDGKEVMQLLQLEPGPVVGHILEEIRELQVVGEIKTRQQVLTWLDTRKRSNNWRQDKSGIDFI